MRPCLSRRAIAVVIELAMIASVGVAGVVLGSREPLACMLSMHQATPDAQLYRAACPSDAGESR